MEATPHLLANRSLTYVDWFSADLGKNEVEVLKHVSNYLDPVDSELLLDLLATSELKNNVVPWNRRTTREAEALALLHALQWTCTSQLANVVFELDFKTVLDGNNLHTSTNVD
ncbi:hypothetical protein JHK87_035616 [Glycine soja]|nr:hypothetical protein JHK87_035616 [Glycine soja]